MAAILLIGGCSGESGGNAGNEQREPHEAAGGEPGSVPASGAAQAGEAESGTATSAEAAAAPQPPPAPQGPVIAAAEPAKPPPAFAQCRTCHSVEPGKHAVGPSLFGVVGRKAGSQPDYNYSQALEQSGIVWNRDTLDQWLAGPVRMVPGTRMVMPTGDETQRKAIIDYLDTLR